MSFTPGPWRTDREMDGAYFGSQTWVRASNGKAVAKTTNQTRLSSFVSRTYEAEANARLIAAAPDLLAACEELSRYKWEGSPDLIEASQYNDAKKRALAAIEKARGEE